MFKIFAIFLVISVNLISANLECSSNKVQNKCLCKTHTNEYTKLPIYIVDCTGLKIQNFPNITGVSEDLNILDLSVNEIQNLDLKNQHTPPLTQLLLKHNRIDTIPDKFFDSFTSLVHIDLSYNNITNLPNADLFKNAKHLRMVDLSFNSIKTLPSGIFEPLKNLAFLDFGNNPMGSFLIQSSDVLSRILGVHENITRLGLSNVGLENVNADYFGYLKQLKYLDIADNNFELIPTVPYSVEHMDLSGNNFTFISARYLNYHSLKYLKISRMRSLVSIHHYAFYNLQMIEKLILTDCPNLTNFTELAFGIPSKTIQAFPKHLSLARNGLTSLNQSYMHLFRKMNHIDLRDNPWNCECEILWMREFDQELFGTKDMRCVSPSYLKNKLVTELGHTDLQHCFPQIYGKASHRVLIIILTATVIFLLGFIFYLVKYPQNWLHPKQFGIIGPNSPYSPAPAEER